MEFKAAEELAEKPESEIAELSLKISSLDALGSVDNLEILVVSSFANDKVIESKWESVEESTLHSFHCY